MALFHWTGYHAYWVLASFVLILALLTFTCALAERLVAASRALSGSALARTVLYGLIHLYWWGVFVLVLMYYLWQTAPREKDHRLHVLDPTLQIIIFGSTLLAVIFIATMAKLLDEDLGLNFGEDRRRKGQPQRQGPGAELPAWAGRGPRPWWLLFISFFLFPIAFVLRQLTEWISEIPCSNRDQASHMLNPLWQLLMAAAFYYLACFILLLNPRAVVVTSARWWPSSSRENDLRVRRPQLQ